MNGGQLKGTNAFSDPKTFGSIDSGSGYRLKSRNNMLKLPEK
jgi:hypothetical protein